MNRNPIEFIKENDAELFDHITSFRQMALKDSALSAKYKLLIALALDAAHGAADGVTSLAKQAMAAGATKEEIFDTVRVAYYISGVGSVYTAARGLNELF